MSGGRVGTTLPSRPLPLKPWSLDPGLLTLVGGDGQASIKTQTHTEHGQRNGQRTKQRSSKRRPHTNSQTARTFLDPLLASYAALPKRRRTAMAKCLCPRPNESFLRRKPFCTGFVWLCWLCATSLILQAANCEMEANSSTSLVCVLLLLDVLLLPAVVASSSTT